MYEELAVRFAEQRRGALAIDCFGGRPSLASGTMQRLICTSRRRKATRSATTWAPPSPSCEKARERSSSCFHRRLLLRWEQFAAPGHGEHSLLKATGFYRHPTRKNRGRAIAPIQDFRCLILGSVAGAERRRSRSSTAPPPKPRSNTRIYTYPGRPHLLFNRRYNKFSDAGHQLVAAGP